MAATGYYESWLTGPSITWLSPETKYSAQTPSSAGYWCSSVTFNFDQGGYKYYSQACYVDVYCGSEYIGTLSWTGSQGQRLNQTMNIPFSPSRVGQQLHYTMTQSGFRNLVVEQVQVTPCPWCASQPTINSVSTPQGTSASVTCTNPSWYNVGSPYQGNVYVQWFCSTSSTYSDAWHVGTTVANNSFTFTKEMLLSKGATDGTTMYLFCRSYFDITYSPYSQYPYTTAWWPGETPSPSATFVYKNDDNTISVFNGSTWQECIPYVFDGSNYVKCTPYTFNGSAWVECSIS